LQYIVNTTGGLQEKPGHLLFNFRNIIDILKKFFLIYKDQSGTFWDDWSSRGPLEKETTAAAEYRAHSTGRPDGRTGQMSDEAERSVTTLKRAYPADTYKVRK